MQLLAFVRVVAVCLLAQALCNVAASAATLTTADSLASEPMSGTELRPDHAAPGRPYRPIFVEPYRTPVPLRREAAAQGSDDLSPKGFYFLYPTAGGSHYRGQFISRYLQHAASGSADSGLASPNTHTLSSVSIDAAPVPLPAGLWLFGSAVAALAPWLRPRRQTDVQVTECFP